MKAYVWRFTGRLHTKWRPYQNLLFQTSDLWYCNMNGTKSLPKSLKVLLTFKEESFHNLALLIFPKDDRPQKVCSLEYCGIS